MAATYVADNTAKGIKAGDLAFWADQITEPTLNFTSETEEIMDAHNNVVMVLQNGRGATFGASNAFFNTSILAAQTGSKVGAVDDSIIKYEILTLDADLKAKTSYAVDSNLKAYALNSDGSFKTAIPVVFTTGDSEEDLDFASSGLAIGDKVLVSYEVSTSPSGETIRAFADSENELLEVTAEILLRDLCDQSVYYAFLNMRGKVSGEAEWSMARDGAHAFEITALPEYCGDKQLVEIIIVKGEDL